MKQHLLPALLSLLLLLGLTGPARAATPPPITGRPLAEALNPDGTLKAGLNGSFDARAFRMRTAPDGRPVFRPAGTTGAGDERWADGFGISTGVNGNVSAVVQSGADLYVGGTFQTAGTVVTPNIAKWNGTSWSSLGAGLNGSVYALALAPNGDLYAGGIFFRSGGLSISNVAKWNGTVWSSVGTGAGNEVRALVIASSGNVYAGGAIYGASGSRAGFVKKWNGTAWADLSASLGVTGIFYALAIASNGDVYAAGNFIHAGATTNNVLKWNGTAWSSLGTGMSMSGIIYSLAVAGNGDLYASGAFTQAGGVAALNVAKWNGTAWSALGTGLNETIGALAVTSNGDVYAGGGAVVGPSGVARWNGTSWSPLATPAGNGFNASINVSALCVANNGDVYAGGYFNQTNGIVANCVARWNGTAWNALAMGAGKGIGQTVYAVAVAGNGDVYAGGMFAVAGDVAVNGVAKWNGTTWSALGTGVNARVYSLAIAGNGDVYAGGDFTQAGGVAASYVAKWNGTTWSALGTGASNGVITNSGINTVVLALAVAPNGDVYAGGVFNQAGGVAANAVAKWNGTTWSALGAGASNGLTYGSGGNAIAYSLAVAGNGDVYAGGSFNQAGGVAASNVVKWNGTTWSSMSAGTSNWYNITVTAVAVASNGDVYAGGAFVESIQSGGGVINYVVKWNGTTWSALGAGPANGPSGLVYSLSVAGNGDLYAGGTFTQVNGTTASNVAKWNGTTWSPLGTGVDASVKALAKGPNGQLYVGGEFASTGDGSKAMAHFGIYDPNAVLATTAARATPAAQLFPNPAHGTATLRLPAGTPRQLLLLTDALGRTVRRYPAPAAAEAELDLRGLPAGVYSVRCGQLSQRLVVE